MVRDCKSRTAEVIKVEFKNLRNNRQACCKTLCGAGLPKRRAGVGVNGKLRRNNQKAFTFFP